MAALGSQTIASSFEQLLHVDTDGGGATTTLVPVKDGDNGTTFAMQLSTTTVCIDDPTTSSATQGGVLRLQSDDGAVMASGHRLGVIEFGGAEDTSSTITTGARIEALADATWSASENGADMVFYTTDGNASQSEVMRLTADAGTEFTGAVTMASSAVTMSSSSASEPILHITNTHDGATSGELRFNKDSTGDDSDIMGLISFYGTDSSDNTHERLAYMDAIITDSAHGSEAASLRFYVAENDATLTQGLALAGQADADGEIDVTIGAGAASTCTIAGGMTMTAGNILMDGSAGQGIDFSGSQGAAAAGSMTSEVLDSYEEGTWSPVIKDESANAMTLNGAFDTGFYTKVGNLVTVTGFFVSTSLGSASGGIRINGLPFTINNNSGAYSGGAAAYAQGYSITAGQTAGFYAGPNNTYLQLQLWDSTGGTSDMQASEWTDDGQIIISVTYRAA